MAVGGVLVGNAVVVVDIDTFGCYIDVLCSLIDFFGLIFRYIFLIILFM